MNARNLSSTPSPEHRGVILDRTSLILRPCTIHLDPLNVKDFLLAEVLKGLQPSVYLTV